MRAVIINAVFNKNDVVEILDYQVHHLLHVIRVQESQEIKVLNGQGLIGIGVVTRINKKVCEILITSIKLKERFHDLSLILSVPKIENLESILKMSAELALKSIYLVKTCHSINQKLNEKKLIRLNKMIDSSLIQSNNPWRPVLHDIVDFKTFINDSKEQIYYFSLVKNSNSIEKYINNGMVLIGPEAGLTKEEEEILDKKNSKFIRLNFPILRTVTCVPVAISYIVSLIK